VKANTRKSTGASPECNTASASGACDASTVASDCAIIRPTAAPATASSTLSVSSCRTSRPRLAPIAARIDTSRVRPADRASSRFATFTHAISSTQHTAPNSTISELRVSRTSASRSRTALAPGATKSPPCSFR
jgi:hypothetical protein